MEGGEPFVFQVRQSIFGLKAKTVFLRVWHVVFRGISKFLVILEVGYTCQCNPLTVRAILQLSIPEIRPLWGTENGTERIDDVQWTQGQHGQIVVSNVSAIVAGQQIERRRGLLHAFWGVESILVLLRCRCFF